MAKPPLLILHGALGSAEAMQPLADALSHSFECITLTFKGHGLGLTDQDFLFPYSIAEFADQAIAELEIRGIAQADLFGYSMGGYVGTWAALHQPKRFKSVTTLGTNWLWNPDHARRGAAGLDPRKIQEKVPAFAQTLQERHGAHWEQVLHSTAELLTALGEGKWCISPRVIAALNVPIRILQGDKDNTVSPEEGQMMAEAAGGKPPPRAFEVEAMLVGIVGRHSNSSLSSKGLGSVACCGCSSRQRSERSALRTPPLPPGSAA